MIKSEVQLLSPGIICICEYWISASEVNVFAIDGYVGFSSCRINRRGGEFLLLAQAHLRPFPLSITCDDHDECSIVSIKLGYAVHNVVITSDYRP